MGFRSYLRLGLLTCVIGAMPVMAQEEPDPDEDGGGFLENLIEDRLSSDGFQVRVSGFEGALSSRATVASIQISDEEGVWLTVNDAVLDWNRAALLRGRLSVEELTAAEVILPRLPQGEERVDVPSPEAQPFQLPELPVSIELGRLAIERVELGQPVIGEETVMTLEGSASLSGGSGEVDITAERIDDETGIFRIAGSYDNDGRELAIDVTVEEGPDGIVASLANLPGRPSVEASIQGEGPLSDFDATIDLNTDGEPRLQGTVSLRETDNGAQGFAVDLGGDVTALFAPNYRPFFGPDVSLQASGAQGAEGGFTLNQFELAADSITLQGEVSVGADGVPDLIDVTGQIANESGPVLLPVGGEVRVSRVGLDIGFDASVSEEWDAEIVLEGFDQTGLEAERIALDGGGVIAGAGDDLSITAGFDLIAAGLAFDDGGIGQAVGDEITGRIEIGYDANQPIQLQTLRINGDAFTLNGQGQVDPDGENVPLSLTAQLDADDLSIFAALAGTPLAGGASVDLSLEAQALSGAFDVSLEGRAQDLAIGNDLVDPLLVGATALTLDAMRDETGLRVERLLLNNEALAVNGSADLTSDGGTAEIAARLDDLGRIDPDLNGPATLNLTAQRPEDEWRIVLDADGADAQIAGNATIRELDAESPLALFELAVEAADLSNFSVFAGRELGGSVDLDTRGQTRLNLRQVDVTLDGLIADVQIDQPEADRLLAGQTTIAAQVQRNGPQITVPELTLQNPQVSVSGEAFIASQQSNVDVRIEMPDLSDIVPDMTGPATIVLDAQEDQDGWTVDLDGTGAGARVIADVIVTDLGMDDVAPLASGTAQITVDELSVFSAIANRELGGSVDLSVDGGARFDLSSAEATIEGRTEDLEVGQAEVNRLMDGVTTLNIVASKEGDRIEAPTIQLSNPQVRVAGEGQYGGDDNAGQLNIVFSELGAIVPEMSGQGTVMAFAEQTGETWQISVDADGAGVVLDLLGEVSDIDMTPVFDGEVDLRAADLSRFNRLANRSLSGSVSMQAQGRSAIDASRFDLTANARGQGLRVGIAQVDQLLAGGATVLNAQASRDGANAPIRVQTFALDTPGLDATANGSIFGGASNLTFDARLANLGQFVPNFDGPVTARGRAGQQGSNIVLDVDLTGPQGITASVNGTVAESFDRANLGLTGNAPLRVANPFLGNRALEGDARFDIRLNGPLAPSSATGTVTVAGGRFIDPSLPAVLQDINGTAQLSGGQVQLNLTANKQEGGQIRVAGPISLNAGYNAELGIELVQVVFEDPRLYRTSLNGRVTVTGPLTGGATIGGTIMVGETEVRIPSTGLGVTGPIPDGLVHVNEPADVRRTREKADLIEEPGDGAGGGGGVAFPLDLLIVAENRIFIRGRGLDAELGGQLRLGGTTANVIPSGQFDLIRGRLDLLGQRITLTEGSVFLQGDFDPRIRLVARTDTGDVTVFVIVEGEATEPEITFASEPELPEDEVLSRLLFGRSIEEISPLQAAQLASAVATLAGRGGDGVIARLRQRTGFDDLDVTTDEDGNVGVRAGKYISENVYSDVTVNAAGEAEINLNLDVTDSLTVRGGANNTGETTLGIFFERDY
ncbi:Translocation and assembly module TamB [Rhodobacteraceae bacterium THAF1]|uniref:translocation/assembly module TamB domain-containing protein n=1 Tax=Palleronia sp. THAF1 TaxID=2587842 RepID=UPI000F3C53AB|nr:translocation/assembly module TamB domain-containing protein [Palleronia sp. THAF1]QFU10213.1 Translocation and assembly module TamB [Palleronia sp. THAF1]VDC16882.1 Translocation and assembly module TamB [Rhodobacteraceae bacterium THAF1]